MGAYAEILEKTGTLMESCFFTALFLLEYTIWDEFRPDVTSKIKGIPTYIIWDVFWLLLAARYLSLNKDLAAILCFILIVLFFQRKHTNQIIRMRDTLIEQKYEQLKQLNEEIQIARHDWKNHLLAIHSMMKEEKYDELEEYLSEITDMVSVQQALVVSGNSLLDAILNQKADKAMEKNIQIKVQCDCLNGLKLAEKDSFILIANLLDNAIEAAEKVVDNPWIDIRIIRNKSMLLIRISNSISKKPRKLLERFMTDKKDVKQHGFGMLSVERIVKRYEGEMDTVYDDNRFEVSIMIYDAFK